MCSSVSHRFDGTEHAGKNLTAAAYFDPGLDDVPNAGDSCVIIGSHDIEPRRFDARLPFVARDRDARDDLDADVFEVVGKLQRAGFVASRSSRQ